MVEVGGSESVSATVVGSPSSSVTVVVQAGGVVGVDSVVVSFSPAASSGAVQLFMTGSLVKSSLSFSDMIGGGSDDEVVRCFEWRSCCR